MQIAVRLYEALRYLVVGTIRDIKDVREGVTGYTWGYIIRRSPDNWQY